MIDKLNRQKTDRQSKIREMNSYDNQIASKKRDIEGVKTRIASIRK